MLPAQLCLWEGQKGAPKNSGTHRVSCALLAPGQWGISCLDRQRHRHSSAFVPYFGKWAPGANPASESPSVSSPQPVSLGQWVAGACQQPGALAQPPGMGELGAAQGPVKPAAWMGLFWAGDSAKRKECYQVVEGQAPKQQMVPSYSHYLGYCLSVQPAHKILWKARGEFPGR